MASKLLSDTKEAIYSAVYSKLSDAIFMKMLSGRDINSLLPDIRMKLVSKFNYLPISDVVLPEKSRIGILYQELVNTPQLNKRTALNYEKGRKFFDSYTDFDIHHQSRIIEGILSYPKKDKDVFYRFYHRIQKIDTTLPYLIDVCSKDDQTKVC